MGRLVTASPTGVPHIGLYPYWQGDGVVELHLHKDDEQLVDLAANDRCVFEVDEVLAVVPSYWVHPENAVMATAYHRSVLFDCTATTTADPEVLANQQRRILERYQPEGRYRPVEASDPMYRGMIGMLVAVRLEVSRRRAKFKLAQNRTPELRAKVVRELRARGRLSDDRAADAIQWTLDREA
jgi:predicted FMN-binding regulatory protein PaiB